MQNNLEEISKMLEDNKVINVRGAKVHLNLPSIIGARKVQLMSAGYGKHLKSKGITDDNDMVSSETRENLDDLIITAIEECSALPRAMCETLYIANGCNASEIGYAAMEFCGVDMSSKTTDGEIEEGQEVDDIEHVPFS